MPDEPAVDPNRAYRDTGGDGPPILLTPGLLLDHTSFAAQTELLAPVWRVVNWDHHVHATSQGRPPTDCWDLAVSLFGLLDRLGVERAVIAGSGEGGAVAVRAALLHPDRVRALILIGADVDREPAERRQRFDELAASWRRDGLTDEVVRLASELVAGDASHAPRLRASLRGWSPEQVERGIACLLDRDEVTPRLPEIDAPALVLHGAADPAVPIERARTLCGGLEGCQGVVDVEGAGRIPHVTHPDAVNDTVRAFLGELPG